MKKENELDSTYGISDKELTEKFKASIEIDRQICKIKGLPIARYDEERNKLILNILTERENMPKKSINYLKFIVFAKPNDSSKTTITHMTQINSVYTNADDKKKSNSCNDLEAEIKAEELRKSLLEKGREFTFERILSTDRNLKSLKKQKKKDIL